MQNEKCEMQNEKNTISFRLLNFAIDIIKLTNKINKIPAGSYISGQLTRSATSSGANYEEACGAESRNDFIHKMQIVLKELRESAYWLKLIDGAGLLRGDIIKNLQKEADELIRIIAKSVVTAKNNR